jgi:TonB family protein
MSATLTGSAVQYQVQSDLNRESLPQSNRDPQRKVWWVNSIAASVLGIGVFLTKEPAEFVFRPVEPDAPMVIEIVQPIVQQVVPVDRAVDEEEVVEEVDVAVIQPIVVAADPSKVSFAIEVRGPTVTSADLRKVSPPPAIVQRPKSAPQIGPVIIRLGQEGVPRMEYPIEARRAGIEGSFTLKVLVSAEGQIDDISVLKSSGALLLERAAREHIRRFARLGNGEKREVHIPFEFKFD